MYIGVTTTMMTMMMLAVITVKMTKNMAMTMDISSS
jgi:hypothetical protein